MDETTRRVFICIVHRLFIQVQRRVWTIVILFTIIVILDFNSLYSRSFIREILGTVTICRLRLVFDFSGFVNQLEKNLNFRQKIQESASFRHLSVASASISQSENPFILLTFDLKVKTLIHTTNALRTHSHSAVCSFLTGTSELVFFFFYVNLWKTLA